MFADSYLAETERIIRRIDYEQVEGLALALIALRARGGRLFVLGNGGSAANASHAVNDFRKLCRIEAYAPTDNVAEFSAWANDAGWNHTFVCWLETSHVSPLDAIMVLSVGGGSSTVSLNISAAVSYAERHDIPVLGIVGHPGGITQRVARACVVVPSKETPHVEEAQAVIWHLLVSDPRLLTNVT